MFRVFIVDDDPNFQTLISDLFRFQKDLPAATLDVIVCGAAQDVLIHPDWPQADFVIADYQLGRGSMGSGAALLRLLHQDRPELPALLITSERFEDSARVDPTMVSALGEKNTWFLPKHELGWDTLGSILIPIYSSAD